MSNWVERIKKAQDDEQKRLGGEKANQQVLKTKIREFVEKEVCPAFDEIVKNYPGDKKSFVLNGNLKKPTLTCGSRDNYEWEYSLSFEIKGEHIYLSYSFNKPPEKPIEREFESPHITTIKQNDIINNITDLVTGSL